MSGFTLLTALVNCPLVGFTCVTSRVAHRVEMDGIPVKDFGTAEHATAVCGAQVKLVKCRWKALRTRGTPVTRCPVCNPRRQR